LEPTKVGKVDKRALLCLTCGKPTPIEPCVRCGARASVPRDFARKGAPPQSLLDICREKRREPEEPLVTRSRLFAACGGRVDRGSLVTVGGNRGEGKTTLALEAAASFGEGVLWVDGEMKATQLGDVAERLKLRPAAMRRIERLEARTSKATRGAMRASRRGIVVIDSFHAVTRSDAERDEFAEWLHKDAAREGRVIIVLTRYSKDGTVRGSGSIEYWGDACLAVEGFKAYVDGKCRWFGG